MKIKKIKNKKILEEHLRKNLPLNIYQLGDLDDFFFKYTEWYSLESVGELKHVVLLYRGSELPVILAFCDKETVLMKSLIKVIKDILPGKFYAHLSPGLKEIIAEDHDIEYHGRYLKMSLSGDHKNELTKYIADENIRRLKVSDMDEILEFYKLSYPDNWFDKRMLETGKYFGYFDNGKIAGISGIHVYSAHYRIAALGNITTAPDHRGKSVCTKVTAALCSDLFKTVDVIGLNVNENNKAAIRCYEKLGFRVNGEFDECMFRKDFSPQRH